jgi:Zn-dependent protease
MKWSLFVGKPFGIKIFIHWTFLLLIGWILYNEFQRGGNVESALWSVSFVLAIFGCVTLHELGHALAARQYGIATKDINLLPIGGVANLEKIPREPRQELWVAVAGPLVNLVIAALLWAGLSLLGALSEVDQLATQGQTAGINAQTFLPALMSINVVLVLFNLIPAFPMDGGRVLRALLAMRIDHLQATRTAVAVGQGAAILFVIGGLFYNPFLLLIAIFVYLGAQAELTYEQTSVQLSGHTVGDILIRTYTALHPFEPVSRAVDVLLNTQEKHFLVLEGQTFRGVLLRDDIIRGLRDEGADTPVQRVMQATVPQVSIDMPLEEALELLRNSAVDILPVFDGQTLQGLIDRDNISEFMMVQSALGERGANVSS